MLYQLSYIHTPSHAVSFPVYVCNEMLTYSDPREVNLKPVYDFDKILTDIGPHELNSTAQYDR